MSLSPHLVSFSTGKFRHSFCCDFVFFGKATGQKHGKHLHFLKPFRFDHIDHTLGLD